MTNVPVNVNNQTFIKVTSTNTTSNNNAFNKDFTRAMSKTSADNSNSQESNKVNDKTELSTNPKVEKKREDIIKNRSETKKEADKIDGQNNKTDINSSDTIDGQAVSEEVINEKATEVLTEISEQLDVSEEEVLAAMEALGLQMVDLLNPDNLAGLVVKISGETDMLSLTTNEGLYQTLQNLTETVEATVKELQQELLLTEEQMGSLLSKVKSQLELQQSSTNEKQDSIKDFVDEKAVLGETLTAVGDNLTTKGSIITTEVVIEDSTKSNETQPKPIMDELSKQTVDTEETLETVGADSHSEESNTKGNENSENGSSLFQGFSNQATDSIGAAESIQASLAKADVESIIKQITDFMKIQVKADLTEMELQLHPASLGTINLQIASKGGVITAQFTAQNEAVKQALETQIVQLRENLEQQGIKIEAVEVTIASHEFERNLDKGNDSNAESEQGKKRSTRRIDLNDLSLVEEQEIDPADLLTRDIMEKNGNTVDYTA